LSGGRGAEATAKACGLHSGGPAGGAATSSQYQHQSGSQQQQPAGQTALPGLLFLTAICYDTCVLDSNKADLDLGDEMLVRYIPVPVPVMDPGY